MRYGTIIIGGGLSALTAGIALARRGRRVAIIAAGPVAARENAGAFGLLGFIGQDRIDCPLDALGSLKPSHPYSLIGAEHIEPLALQAADILRSAGINAAGSPRHNVTVYSPLGIPRPAWLARETILSTRTPLPRHIALLNIKGYIDTPMPMAAYHLREQGFDVTTLDIDLPTFATARRTASGMRTISIARALASHKTLDALREEIRAATAGVPRPCMIVMPALIGIDNNYTAQEFVAALDTPLRFLPTPPPSVLGGRLATDLRHYFQMLGGIYRSGERVVSAEVNNHHVEHIVTDRRPGMHIEADNFILATGTLATGGLAMRGDTAEEPLFSLDLDDTGVLADSDLHPLNNGTPIGNLHAVGAILARDPRAHGDREGIAMLTALHAARQIAE